MIPGAADAAGPGATHRGHWLIKHSSSKYRTASKASRLGPHVKTSQNRTSVELDVVGIKAHSLPSQVLLEVQEG